ncbi:MAG TPA: hypothetical protein VF912_03275 [Anaeromyxobacter sp.]
MSNDVKPLAAALCCAMTTLAAARDVGPPGSSDEVRGVLAVRAGVALPFGSARAGVAIGDLLSGAVPLSIELGARGDATTVGFQLSYARAFVAACPRDASCSGDMMRAGLEVLYRFSPGERVSTWAGAGLGWEGSRFAIGARRTRLDALELLNLQLGREVTLRRGTTLGPYLAATFAQFLEQDGTPIAEKAPHAWIELGFRGAFGL